MPIKPRVTDQKVIEALAASAGIIAHAAKKLGYERPWLHTRIKKSPKLMEAYDQIKETNLDLAESKLLQAINNGELIAIFFYLKCKGKSRGYIERGEVDLQVSVKAPLMIQGPQ